MEIQRVLISDSCDPRCAEILTKAGCKVTVKTDHTPQELVENIKNFDALVVRSATKVTAAVINAAPDLKVIGRAGTGVDNIDCETATKNGVLVINAPGGNTLSAAEMTCALIVSLSRDIAAACASLKAGRWDRKNFMSNELNGKTIGIVGLGRIGREVATRMQSFGMRTIGFDPIIPAEAAAEFGVEAMSLDDLWPQCDYITVHTPLIPQTRDLINSKTLAKCKKGVKIVNCARGGIVNENDLLAALESGQASGAGFDVFEEEPPKNTAFIAHPKVICTPHLGANTKEAQARVAIEIAEQFVALRDDRRIAGAVNAPLLAQSQAAENRLIAQLATDLGKVAGALVSGSSAIGITMETCGDRLAAQAKFLSSTVTIGVLRSLGENANLINFGGLAEKRGVSYSHQNASICCGFDECIRITVKGDSSSHVLEGTPGQVSILRMVDQVKLDGGFALTGKLLVAEGPANSLPAVVQSVAALGKITSVTDCGKVYLIKSDICAKSTAAPGPLSRWARVEF
ncbi:D-3-phosphoglycerate dehydrogenase [Galendromus occidentalis]|uniref:D-3-phosphoglycerate dehydrogenase n=1 Tax=Galendromus occidentalis TaxID=34638 RepID=A0AAJ7L8E4_9ACAR|nr:D-3-phosphoglycerate dehydrogenase [Galendromus occidentalis]